jgi:hypothetical protein
MDQQAEYMSRNFQTTRQNMEKVLEDISIGNSFMSNTSIT